MPLGTGDFEAIGPSSIPPASRVPVFHRSAPPPPSYAYGPQSYGPQSYAPHSGYGQQMLSAPPPPNSLAPVAMAAASTGRHRAISTGPNRTAETVTVRERPGMKAGFILVVLGALVGGVLGVGMRARQNQEAAAAAAVQPAATQAPAQAANTIAGPATTTQAPPAVPPTALANLPPGAILVDPSKGTTIPVQPPVVVTPSKDGAKDSAKDASAKPEDDKKKHAGGHKFGGHKAAPAPAEPAPAATPRVATKVNPPEKKDPEPEVKKDPPKSSPAKDKDAAQVLRDAMKESL